MNNGIEATSLALYQFIMDQQYDPHRELMRDPDDILDRLKLLAQWVPVSGKDVLLLALCERYAIPIPSESQRKLRVVLNAVDDFMTGGGLFKRDVKHIIEKIAESIEL